MTCFKPVILYFKMFLFGNKHSTLLERVICNNIMYSVYFCELRI